MESIAKHREIAAANRNQYNHDDELSDALKELAATPYVMSYISMTIEGCIGWMDATEDIKALDVGTVFGHLLPSLLKHTAPENIYAIDIAENNIKEAKRHFPDVNFSIGDFILDYHPSLKFDFIGAYSVLHHFYDWKSFLDKTDTLLNKGGVVYLDHEPLGGIISRLYKLLGKIKNRCNTERLLSEYHEFYGYINPFEITDYFTDKNYLVKVFFSNVSLISEVQKRLKLNISPFLIREVLIDKGYKRLLKNGFMSYKCIAKKS